MLLYTNVGACETLLGVTDLGGGRAAEEHRWETPSNRLGLENLLEGSMLCVAAALLVEERS